MLTNINYWSVGAIELERKNFLSSSVVGARPPITRPPITSVIGGLAYNL